MYVENKMSSGLLQAKARDRNKIIKYNYLVWLLVKKNVKNKYRRSFLGVLWTVLLPLLEMLVMTLVFSSVNGDIDSRIFIMSGVVVFGFNRESTMSAMSSILAARGLIDRVNIPNVIFPLAATFSALANMFFSVLALIALAIVIQFPLSWHFGAVVLNIPALVMFSAGLSIALSAVNVYFRDIGQIYGIFIQLWTFVSAVYINIDALPAFGQTIVKINPMYYYVSNFRQLVMYHSMPSLNNYIISYGMGVLSLLIGVIIFKCLKKNFIHYV